MRIGIDIDGVLVDIVRFVLDYGVKFCYENKIPYRIKENEYDETIALGITEEQSECFWNKYLGLYASKYPVKEFAKEVIDKLKENNEIYIITSRNEEGLPPELYGKMQEMVKQYLQDNEIYYDKLIFSAGSKLPYCEENKIDIMIEDSPKNVKDVSTKIPVLCFDNPYNKEIQNENIIRVYSWYDVLKKVEEIRL